MELRCYNPSRTRPLRSRAGVEGGGDVAAAEHVTQGRIVAVLPVEEGLSCGVELEADGLGEAGVERLDLRVRGGGLWAWDIDVGAEDATLLAL